jgi:hypothetical protein
MSGSSVIPFRNHKDLQIFHGCRFGMSVMVGIAEYQECCECQNTDSQIQDPTDLSDDGNFRNCMNITNVWIRADSRRFEQTV